MPVYENSRYTFSAGITDSFGRLFLTPPEPYTYREFPDNISHPVISGDSWMSIAGKHYAGHYLRPETLFGFIMDFQPDGPLVDPTIPPQPGSTVVVPSPRTVKEEILAEARRSEVPG